MKEEETDRVSRDAESSDWSECLLTASDWSRISVKAASFYWYLGDNGQGRDGFLRLQKLKIINNCGHPDPPAAIITSSFLKTLSMLTCHLVNVNVKMASVTDKG